MRNIWLPIVISLLLWGMIIGGCSTIKSWDTEDGAKYIRSYGFPPAEGKIEDRKIKPQTFPELPPIKLEP